MEKAPLLPAFDSLPLERQLAVERAIDRLKKEYEIPGELLNIEELARVLGLDSKALWNLRSRGRMPAIPIRRIGGHDAFWIGHVAMWLMATHGLAECSSSQPNADDVDRARPAIAAATRGSLPEARRRSPKREMSVAKAALMAKANELFEQKLRERK